MSGKPELVGSDGANIKPLTHERVLWLMASVTVINTALGSVFKTWDFGLAVLIGGLLSFLNYFWLKYSLKKVFELSAGGKKPGIFGAQYFLRYLVFGLILVIIYLTKTVSITAVILGLAGFAFAVVIEGILRIISSVFSKREI